MTRLMESEEERQHRRGDEPSYGKAVGISVLVVSIVGSVFGAGYNWRSVDVLEKDRDQYVRKDVQGQQLQNITDRLAELSRQIQQLQSDLERERRRP